MQGVTRRRGGLLGNDRDFVRRERRRRSGRRFRGGRLGDPEHGQQAGRAAVEQVVGQQGQRVEIGLAPQQTPVQASTGAVERSRPEHGDDLPRCHLVAFVDDRGHRFVGGSQRWLPRAGQRDREDAAARHHAGEGHPAGSGGADEGARSRGEIDAPMAGAVRRGGRFPPS